MASYTGLRVVSWGYTYTQRWLLYRTACCELGEHVHTAVASCTGLHVVSWGNMYTQRWLPLPDCVLWVEGTRTHSGGFFYWTVCCEFGEHVHTAVGSFTGLRVVSRGNTYTQRLVPLPDCVLWVEGTRTHSGGFLYTNMWGVCSVCREKQPGRAAYAAVAWQAGSILCVGMLMLCVQGYSALCCHANADHEDYIRTLCN